MSSNAGDLLVTRGKLAVRRNDAEFFLAGEGFFAQFVPALIELPFVLVGPFLGHVVWGVGGAGGEVDEEGLVGREGFLLPDPLHGLVGHIGQEVVALFGRLLRVDRSGALVECWVPLICFATDEAVEVLETAATGGPRIEGSNGAGLPHGHFVAFAELGRGVAVEQERSRQWGAGVREHRTVARSTACELGDGAHADGVVVASGQ